MTPSRRARALATAVAAISLATCTSAPAVPPFDATAESAKLLRRDAEWADLATAGKDVDRIVSYWTDDAVLMEPGQPPIEGKAAIRSFVAKSLATPGFKIHWVSQPPTFSPDGKLAYMRGADETTVPGDKGGTVTLHSQGVSIWRVDADGQWRCVVDIATEAAPPASAAKR